MAINPAFKDKVVKYEAFLNNQLRPDLKAILEERDKLYEESSEYLSLKNAVEALRASEIEGNLKTKVDIGCKCTGRLAGSPAKLAVQPNHRVFTDAVYVVHIANTVLCFLWLFAAGFCCGPALCHLTRNSLLPTVA